MISLVTIIVILFVIILYWYLLLMKKSLIFPAKVKRSTQIFTSLCAMYILLLIVGNSSSLDQRLQLFASFFVVLSFLLNSRGLTDEAVLVYATDHRGIPYPEIEKVVLFVREDMILFNYFRKQRRGVTLIFTQSLDELLTFFKTHLPETTEVDVIFEEH